MKLKIIDMKEWIEENKTFFIPPICNKMMHNTQLKVFFVGGPNQRKDYHIEEGEEFFLMIRGDMCLKVIEKGQNKDVIIKEGQVFLLPGRIPHSPQRYPNTIGLVIERERVSTEMDALRYLVEETTDILYERWFHCKDLGTQLVPVIKEFQSSEECKTGKPSKNSRLISSPYSDDNTKELISPFNLDQWIETNEKEITEKGSQKLFSGDFKSNIQVFGGKQTHELQIESESETFLLQLRNTANIEYDSKCEPLKEGKTTLISKGQRYLLKSVLGSYTLMVSMPSLQ